MLNECQTAVAIDMLRR